jgi:hypothetical protein
MLNLIATAAGSTPYMMIYSGTAPSKSGGSYQSATSSGATLLATLPMSNPIGPAASAGVLTLSAITTETGAYTGTPSFFRICTTNTDGTGGANCIAQGTAGVGSGELNFSSQISAGGNVSVTTGMTITNPAAS